MSLRMGIVRKCKFPCCNQVVGVPKTDGSLRMRVVYHPLNRITENILAHTQGQTSYWIC